MNLSKMSKFTVVLLDIPTHLRTMLYGLSFFIFATIVYDCITMTTFEMSKCTFLLLEPDVISVKWYQLLIVQTPFLILIIVLFAIAKRIDTEKTAFVAKKIRSAAIMLIIYLIAIGLTTFNYLILRMPINDVYSLLIWGPLITIVIASIRVYQGLEIFVNFHELSMLALPCYGLTRLLAQVIIFFSGDINYEVAPTINWISFVMQVISLSVFAVELGKSTYFYKQFKMVVPSSEYIEYLTSMTSKKNKKYQK